MLPGRPVVQQLAQEQESRLGVFLGTAPALLFWRVYQQHCYIVLHLVIHGSFFFPLIYVVPNLSHINSIHSILNQPAVLDSVKQISLGGLHKLGDSHRSVRWMSSFVILIHELEIPLTRQKLNQPWHLGSSSLNTAHYSTECGWLRWWVLVLMQGRTLRSRLAWTVVQGKDGSGQLVHALRT